MAGVKEERDGTPHDDPPGGRVDMVAVGCDDGSDERE
jgi:hypothetical protein